MIFQSLHWFIIMLLIHNKTYNTYSCQEVILKPGRTVFILTIQTQQQYLPYNLKKLIWLPGNISKLVLETWQTFNADTSKLVVEMADMQCRHHIFSKWSGFTLFCLGVPVIFDISFRTSWGWSGGAKVSCILYHQGVQLILAYSWARPAILVAGKGREVMFLFLLFLHFQSCSSFFPVPLFHLFCYLFCYLFCLFSPFLWETTQNDS